MPKPSLETNLPPVEAFDYGSAQTILRQLGRCETELELNRQKTAEVHRQAGPGPLHNQARAVEHHTERVIEFWQNRGQELILQILIAEVIQKAGINHSERFFPLPKK